MKYIILVLAILATSCDRSTQTKTSPLSLLIPRPVYNSCTGRWAVLSDSDIYQEDKFFFPEARYFGKMFDPRGFTQSDLCRVALPNYFLSDSGNAAAPGYEFTFADSTTAMRVFNAFLLRARKYSPHLTDPNSKQQKQDDSIFNCQHTYQSL